MTALDVAAAYGLPLRQKGVRHWACCPLHGEKTASLCFFPDGRFHCFGCHAHGDAADLYAALYGVPLAEALRMVRDDEQPCGPRKPTAADLRRRVEAWKSARWAEACGQKHAAQAVMRMLEQTRPPDALERLDNYWNAIQQAAEAEDVLNLLDSATPAQLLRMIAEANAA